MIRLKSMVSDRPALYLTAIGFIALIAGLGLDTWLHATGAASEDEELFGFSNPGHVLTGGGLLITAGGLLAGLIFGWTGGRSPRLIEKVLAVLLVASMTGTFVYGFTNSTSHGHDHVAGGLTKEEL